MTGRESYKNCWRQTRTTSKDPIPKELAYLSEYGEMRVRVYPYTKGKIVPIPRIMKDLSNTLLGKVIADPIFGYPPGSFLVTQIEYSAVPISVMLGFTATIKLIKDGGRVKVVGKWEPPPLSWGERLRRAVRRILGKEPVVEGQVDSAETVDYARHVRSFELYDRVDLGDMVLVPIPQETGYDGFGRD